MSDDKTEEPKSTRKDTSEKKEARVRFQTPIVATLIASLVATYATYTYNDRQMQLARITALDKYRTYINSDDSATREYGYFVFEELGYSKLVDRLAEARDDGAALSTLLDRLKESSDSAENSKTAQIADKIMRDAPSIGQDTIPPPVSTNVAGTTKEGWLYLGHYVSEENKWKTRYLNFAENEIPSDLVGETFQVREVTGALNVRKGMPTLFGQFRDVKEVLEVNSSVMIINYSEWQSSGYMWAKVSYGT